MQYIDDYLLTLFKVFGCIIEKDNHLLHIYCNYVLISLKLNKIIQI